MRERFQVVLKIVLYRANALMSYYNCFAEVAIVWRNEELWAGIAKSLSARLLAASEFPATAFWSAGYPFCGGGYFLKSFSIALFRFLLTLAGSLPEPKVLLA